MTRTSTAPDDDQLHAAIFTMDGLADEGFAQIAVMAELATSELCKHMAQSQSERFYSEAGAVTVPPVADAQTDMGA